MAESKTQRGKPWYAGVDRARRRVLYATFAGWTFDRLRRQLTSPQQVVVALSSAEFRLLSAFVDHPNRVLSRDQLLDLTRAPGADVTDRSIDLTVSRLRQKLDAPNLIRTVRGEGYLFDPNDGGARA